VTLGFVLVDKPAGPTSHDVVARVRKRLDIRRVGHAGTLDPAASGLLVVAVGPATRLISYVQGLPKTYETTGRLGVRTTTLDAAGDVIEECDVKATADDVRGAAASFIGEIEQVPPAHSAVKVGGERAYKLARRGEQPDIAPRTVTVYEFDVTGVRLPDFDACIVCSAGTYVRTLVSDVGDALGCGAHVAALRRTAIGALDVADAVVPDDVNESHVRCVEDVLTHLPRVDVDDETAARARNGRAFEAQATGETLVVAADGAVGVFRPDGELLRPVTVLGR
jgi:tRNA pseudouridine55 synthase